MHALGNIAGDSVELRDIVLRGNVLPELLRHINLSSRATKVRIATTFPTCFGVFIGRGLKDWRARARAHSVPRICTLARGGHALHVHTRTLQQEAVSTCTGSQRVVGKLERPFVSYVDELVLAACRCLLGSFVFRRGCKGCNWGAQSLPQSRKQQLYAASAQLVIDAGLCRPLVNLLTHPSDDVRAPALRAVGNIVLGDDRQTKYWLT